MRTDETNSSDQVLRSRRDQKLWQRWLRRDVVQVTWLRPSLLCLKKESACAFENPVHLYQTRRRHPTRQHFYARDVSVSYYREAPTALALPTEHTQQQIILKICIKHKIRKFSKLFSWPEGVQHYSVPCCEPHRQISAHNAQTKDN